METSTQAARGPHRTMVWSHNTSYAGAAGVHSETGRTGRAVQASGQRDLHTTMSTIRSLHQKELRALGQHRKSLESSMLAYSEKMRKISSERGQLASTLKPKAGDDSRPEGKSLAGVPSSTRTSVSGAVDTTSRVSVDSGVEMSGSGQEVARTVSSSNSLLSVPTISVDNSHQSRPTSLLSVNSSDTKPGNNEVGSTSRTPETPRQRRRGTMDKPDVFALKLSLDRAEDDSDVSTAHPDPSVAIMPFPEHKPDVVVTETDAMVAPKDKRRNQATSSRSPQASPKKVVKTKDNYWSYRKAQHRLSLPNTHSLSLSKNQSPAVTPSPSPRPRLIKLRKASPKPRRSNKTFHTTFRYSDAVDGVMRSLDEMPSTPVSNRAIRRASQILPALDFHDLRQQRLRVKQESGRETGDHSTSSLSSILSEPDTTNNSNNNNQDSNVSDNDENNNSQNYSSGNDNDNNSKDDCDNNNVDTEDSGDDNDSTATPTYWRERSFSAPDIMNVQTGERSGERSSEGGSGGDSHLSAQRKSNSCDNDYGRKAVHFSLPPIHTLVEE